MQATKVKVGEVYAYRRGTDWVRYIVDAKISRNDGDRTQTTLEGYIVEDGAGLQNKTKIELSPSDLKGPYHEMAELVERKAKEEAKRKADSEARKAELRRQREVLYRFIGVKPNKDESTYGGRFRIGYNSIDVSQQGVADLVAKIESLESTRSKGDVLRVKPEHEALVEADTRAQFEPKE